MHERNSMQRIVKTVTDARGKLYATGGEIPIVRITFDHGAKTEFDRQRIESIWIREIW